MKHYGVLLVMAGLLAGCISPGNLYPVEGQLATQTPLPVFVFQHFAGGATVAAEQVYKGPGVRLNPKDPAAGGLQAEWDRVYGPGYFVANILGNSDVWHYTLTGDKGGHMEVEVMADYASHNISFKGVARDSQGNIFKLAF